MTHYDDAKDNLWDAQNRIAEIDRMFETATGWGSWMVTASNERKGLVNRLREAGHQIDHKYETDVS